MVKHLKAFDKWYGRDDQFTDLCNKQVETNGPFFEDGTIDIEFNRMWDDQKWFDEAQPSQQPVIVPMGGKVNSEIGETLKSKTQRTPTTPPPFKDKAFSRNAYTNLHPTFTHISNLVKTEGDFQEVQESLNKVLQCLLEKQKQNCDDKMKTAKPGVVKGDGKVISFPQIDTRHKDIRKNPFNSPSNIKNK
jgi:hypothetical protein